MRTPTFLRGLASSLLLAASALASTIVVDANGSGQFTNIPPAIAAAQDGDVIVVLPGSYSGFALTKSLTIVGVGNPILSGPSTIGIQGIPANRRAAVVGLRAGALSISQCAGHVIAQEIASNTGVALAVTQSADVRLRALAVRGPAASQGSRVEMVRCTVVGPSGADGAGADGEPGFSSGGTNRLHLVDTDVTGGNGGDSYDHTCTWGGNGRSAIWVLPTDTVIVANGRWRGGTGGGATSCFGSMPCFYNGSGSSAVWVDAGGTLRVAGVDIAGGLSWIPTTCAGIQEPAWSGPGSVVDGAGDPSLDLTGAPIPGTTMQFVVQAPPGSAARLVLGRAPVVADDGLALVERLVAPTRIVGLGTVPALGQVIVSWTVPPVARGTFLVVQAEAVLVNGELRRTNSIPVVVR